MEPVDDEELVARFAEAGDGKAMEILFRRHLNRVYSLARRYFPIKEDAEEIVSETYFRCFKALRDGSFRGDCLFRTWLTRIAINVSLERLRQPRLPTLIFETLADVPADAPNGESSDLATAVAQMPDDQRLVLTLCDLEGYDDKEAAVMIGRTLTATKSLHYRGRRTLRDLLVKLRGEADGV